MEVGAEAKRIMVVALGKLYSSRTQRGGLRLHRSLLLTLVMKSARDMYHAAAQLEEEEEEEEAVVAPSCDPARIDLPSDSETAQQPEPLSQGEAEDREVAVEEVSEAVTQPERTGQTFTHGQTPQSRKRRGKIAAVPDFLPLKKAKLDCPQTQLVVLVDYVTCGDLGTAPSPIPVPMAIAAC